MSTYTQLRDAAKKVAAKKYAGIDLPDKQPSVKVKTKAAPASHRQTFAVFVSKYKVALALSAVLLGLVFIRGRLK